MPFVELLVNFIAFQYFYLHGTKGLTPYGVQKEFLQMTVDADKLSLSLFPFILVPSPFPIATVGHTIYYQAGK